MGWKGKMGLAGLGGLTIGLISKEAGRKFLSQKLGEIPGIPAKVGQMLSFGKSEFTPVKNCLDVETILDLIQEDCPKLYADLVEIDENPRVASLSQVHRGVLRDGSEVAIKVQFPNLHSEMEGQFDALFEGFKKYGPGRKQDFDWSEFQSHFRSSLLEELDYRKEALQQKKFFDHFKKYENILIPEVYFEYCSDQVLTQSWVNSVHLDEIKKMDVDQRALVSHDLIYFQLASIFEFGLVHGDLHSMNWGYDFEKSCLVVYDFGSTQALLVEEVAALSDVFRLHAKAPSNEYFNAWIKLGFDFKQLLPMVAKLPELTAIFRAPLSDPNFNFKDWRFSEKVSLLLGEQKWNFRLSGPPWFLGWMKSCQGVVLAAASLQSRQDIPGIFEEIFGKAFFQEEVGNDLAYSLPKTLSQFLRVQILQNGDEIVALEFPATSAGHLCDLIPADSLKKIVESGNDVQAISKKAVANNFFPQTLFEAKIDLRVYKIWLE